MSAGDSLKRLRATDTNLDQPQVLDGAAQVGAPVDQAALLWLDGQVRDMYRAETEEPVPEAMLALVRRLTGRDGS